MMPLFCNAAVLYSADFSISGQGATHDNVGDALEAAPVSGANWELTYGALSSDGTTNEFVTLGGVMRVQDWGGEGVLTSDVLDIAADGVVDITGSALAIGTDAFNVVGTEGITWFYSINDVLEGSHFIGEAELGIGSVDAGTDLGHAFGTVPVTAGDQLRVGFKVLVDGADDGVEVSSLRVDFSTVPEPSSLTFGAIAGFLLMRRRKRL